MIFNGNTKNSIVTDKDKWIAFDEFFFLYFFITSWFHVIFENCKTSYFESIIEQQSMWNGMQRRLLSFHYYGNYTIFSNNLSVEDWNF